MSDNWRQLTPAIYTTKTVHLYLGSLFLDRAMRNWEPSICKQYLSTLNTHIRMVMIHLD